MHRVVIDELVLEKDLKKITQVDQQRIFRAIRNKLNTNPEEFGMPLRGEFSSLRNLRVGQYRIIFRIEEEMVRVYVIMIGYRRNEKIYDAINKKFGSNAKVPGKK